MGFSFWKSGFHIILTLPYVLGNVQLSPNRTRKFSSEALFPEATNQCELRSLGNGGL